MSPSLLLASGRLLVAQRVAALEARVRSGDESAWSGYLDALQALRMLTQGAPGQLLTTAEMAERLGVTSKSLLKRVSMGSIAPAVKAGRLLRWSGSETLVAASARSRPRQRPSVLGARVATGIANTKQNDRSKPARRPA